jgi:hypothetical protein
MTMDNPQDREHELDRKSGESDTEYNERIENAARQAGQSRAQYERAANQRAGRPAINRQDGESDTA